MAVIGECSTCHAKQSTKSKRSPIRCEKCGATLSKFWIVYKLGGKQVWERAVNEKGENLGIADARTADGKRRSQKKEGKIKTILDVKPIRLTVNELTKWYLSLDYIKDRRNKEVNLRDFNERFGNRKVEEVTDSDLKNYQAWLKKKGFADATVDYRLSSVRVLIIQAFKDRKVTRQTRDTFTLVERLLAKGPDGKPANAREGVYSYDQIVAIGDVIKSRSKLPWKILSWSGMREGEVLNLKADRIDLDNRMIRLRPEDTKERKKKDIPILDNFEEIEKLCRERPGQNLFAVDYTDVNPCDAFVYDVKCVHKKLGIPYGRGKETLTTHSLRHTYKTNATRANVSQSARMRLQGHTTSEMDLRYTHLNDDDLKRDAKRIFDQMVKGQGDQVTDASEERLLALIQKAIERAIFEKVDKRLIKSPLEQKEAGEYVS